MRDPALRAVAIAAFIYFLDGLIHSLLGPLAPELARDLELGNADLGPVFSANLIGQCIGLVTFPVIARRTGQRLSIILAVAGFGAFQCASALAEGATSLFALRLATGIFLGGCLPGCLAVVTELAPPKRRGVAIMALFTGYGLGATIAGIVAGGFANTGGWRAAMLAVGAVSLVTAWAAWLWLREPSRLEGGDAETAPGDKLAELRLLSPPYLPGTLMLWLLFVGMLTISYCLNSWLPIMLTEVGRDETYAALSVSIFSFGGVVAALCIGLLIDRIGAMRVLIVFTVCAAVSLFLIGLAMEAAPKAVLTPLLAAAGFFSLGAYGGVNVVLASFYPDSLRAAGIGWAKSVGRVGTVIAPVLIGIGLTAGMRETLIMSLFAVPALAATLSLVTIARSSRWKSRESV